MSPIFAIGMIAITPLDDVVWVTDADMTRHAVVFFALENANVTMRLVISSWQRLSGSGVGPDSRPLDPVHGRHRD